MKIVTKETVKVFYFKRWSSLYVRIHLSEKRIVEAVNEHTAKFIREYKRQIEENIREEKSIVEKLDDNFEARIHESNI